MDVNEYEEVKGMSYGDFYKYLVNKYGRPEYNYNPSRGRSPSQEYLYMDKKRDNEGLLEFPYYSYQYPYNSLTVSLSGLKGEAVSVAWNKEYLCFADALEVLFLLILIGERCLKDPKPAKTYNRLCSESALSMMGLLNDLYAGRFSKTAAQPYVNLSPCRANKNVYYTLVKRLASSYLTINKNKPNWFATSSYMKGLGREKWKEKLAIPYYTEMASTIGLTIKPNKIKFEKFKG